MVRRTLLSLRRRAASDVRRPGSRSEGEDGHDHERLLRPDPRVLSGDQYRVRAPLAGEDRRNGHHQPVARRLGKTGAERHRRSRGRCGHARPRLRRRRPSHGRKADPQGLAGAAAAQQLALHIDHRVPGAQRQPQGDSRLERSRPAPASRSSRRIRRRPAARAGTISRPGPTPCGKGDGDEAKAQGVRRAALPQRARARFGRARFDDHVRAAWNRRRLHLLGERGPARAGEARRGRVRDRHSLLEHPRRAVRCRSSTRWWTGEARARSRKPISSSSIRRRVRRSPRKHHYRPRLDDRPREARGEVPRR